MARLLITGSKGFIGSHALEQAHKYGHVVLSSFDWQDSDYIDELFHITDIETVMHFGAISSTIETDVNKVMHQNYDFSVWLLNLCNDLNIPFQWSSSASIYGLGNEFHEFAPPDPRTPYAWSKYMFERYIMNKHWKIPVQTFRYFNVYGDKGEEHKGNQASPYFKFKQQALKNGVIYVFENSHEYFRDFIHIDTLLELQFEFLKLPISGTWNIGTGKPKSFLEVAQEIAEKYNAKIEFIPMPENLKNSYQKYTCADLTNLNNTLSRFDT